MKKLFSFLIILTISSVSVFSQTETYLSLVKKSVDSLSVQLQIKERIRSYSLMDIIVEDFNSGAITIPSKFFSKYFNESFSNSNSVLKQAYNDYLDNNQRYNYSTREDNEYKKIMKLPSNNADEVKTRNDKLAVLRYQRYNNDLSYKDLLDKNITYVKRYHIQILSQLYSSYKVRNEIFPVSMLGIDDIISRISNSNSAMFSMTKQIDIIKNMMQSMNRTEVTDDFNNKSYSSRIVDSLIIVKKQNIENVRNTPSKIMELEKRLTELTASYNKLVFQKYIEMRIADSSSIEVFTNPIATNRDYINSVDSLCHKRKIFESKDSLLRSILHSDKEYSALYKKIISREISNDVFKSESSFIISRRFKYDVNYTNTERERDRALFQSNISILRHLLEITSQGNSIFDFHIIPINELNQIIGHPELFTLENEINNIKNLIVNSWSNYYQKRYGIPYVKNMRYLLY